MALNWGQSKPFVTVYKLILDEKKATECFAWLPKKLSCLFARNPCEIIGMDRFGLAPYMCIVA